MIQIPICPEGFFMQVRRTKSFLRNLIRNFGIEKNSRTGRQKEIVGVQITFCPDNRLLGDELSEWLNLSYHSMVSCQENYNIADDINKIYNKEWISDFKFMHNQFNVLIKELSSQTSRRAFVSFAPVGVFKILNDSEIVYPCINHIWYTLYKGQLKGHCLIRSSNVKEKLVQDMFLVRAFSELVANEVEKQLEEKISIGEFIFTLLSVHEIL